MNVEQIVARSNEDVTFGRTPDVPKYSDLTFGNVAKEIADVPMETAPEVIESAKDVAVNIQEAATKVIKAVDTDVFDAETTEAIEALLDLPPDVYNALSEPVKVAIRESVEAGKVTSEFAKQRLEALK